MLSWPDNRFVLVVCLHIQFKDLNLVSAVCVVDCHVLQAVFVCLRCSVCWLLLVYLLSFLPMLSKAWLFHAANNIWKMIFAYVKFCTEGIKLISTRNVGVPNVMAALPNIGGALCSTPQFGWRPLLDCRAVTLPRHETCWNYLGYPKLTKGSQPLVGRSSPYYRDM